MLKDITIGLKVALLLILVFINYVTAVTFFDVPIAGREVAKTVVPYLLGVITIFIGFYWGNSHKTNEPEINPTTIDAVAIAAAAKIEMERIAAAKVEAEKVEEERIKAASVVAESVIEKAKTEEVKT